MRYLIRRALSLFCFLALFFTAAVPIQASSPSNLTVYAQWNTQVTFDANGGVLTGGSTAAERALAGQASGSIAYRTGQSVATGLFGQKENCGFLFWNTRPDGSGTDLEDYGIVTGPVTFYALYSENKEWYYTDPHSDFGEEVVYTVPYSGIYFLECWGSRGGYDGNQTGGRGGYSWGYVHLDAGTRLYINVGNTISWPYGGFNNNYPASGLTGGYNGGGTPNTLAACGGGATSIGLRSGCVADFISPQNAAGSILLVAGGGGAGADRSLGGTGGGTAGGYDAADMHAGGTQTSGYAFGTGAPANGQSGGGGGGWYGGTSGRNDWYGGAGGSGYLNTALGIVNGGMQNGVDNGTPHYGQEGGEATTRLTMTDTGKAAVSLYQID